MTLALAGLAIAAVLRPGLNANEVATREYTLHWMFPGAFRPISDQAIALSDMQPGYTALALFAVAGITMLIRPRRDVAAMFAGACFLVCILVPIPGLNPLIFAVLPGPLYNFALGLFVRFTPLMYTLMSFGGALALGAFLPPGAHWWRRCLVTAGLLLAIAWNVAELGEPLKRIDVTRSSPAGTDAFYRSENATGLLIYNELPVLPYSDETINDPLLKSHVLRRERDTVIPDPILARDGGAIEAITATPDPANPGQFVLQPRIQIKPGERLLLLLQDIPPSLHGYLDIGGGGTRRIVDIPQTRGNLEITIWNSDRDPRDLGWRLVTDSGPNVPTTVFAFARGQFHPYKVSDLQIRTRSLIPYRAEVRLDQPARLETPRVSVPGYTAIVNGRPVRPETSSNGLVTVPIEPGDNTVEVEYHGTGLMRFAWLVSAVCWAGLIARLLLARSQQETGEAAA